MIFDAQNFTERYIKYIQFFVTFIFILFIFLFYLKPLIDPDLPWHLKTGEIILQTHSVPSTDTFSFANDNESISFVGEFILKQYWLGQIFLAAIYKLAGPTGLVLLRSFVFTLIVFIVRSIIFEKGYVFSLLFSGFYVGYLLSGYYSLRPVLFTFLFSSIVLWMLEKYRKSSSVRYILALPFLMLVWSNIHGGYIFGLLLLAIYLFVYCLNSIFNKYLSDELQSDKSIPIIVIVVLSFIFSFLNPNGWLAIKYSFSSHLTEVFDYVIELKSPLNPGGNFYFIDRVIEFWCVLPLNIIIMILSFRKRMLLPFLLTLVPTLMACIAIRYIPFMAISVCVALNSISVELSSLSRFSNKFCYPALIALLVFGISDKIRSTPANIFYFMNNISYPVSAVNFMKKNSISGNIIASYNKSSFIVFSLYPDSKVFIDSRSLYPHRVKTAFSIEGKYDPLPEKRKLIQKILFRNSKFSSAVIEPEFDKNDSISKINQSGADIIIYETVDKLSGNIFLLPLKLFFVENWKIVYADGRVLIFLKDVPKFRDAIDRLTKNKSIIFDQIIREVKNGGRSGLSDYYTNIAFGLMAKGQTDKEVEALIMAGLELSPDNWLAITCRDFLKQP